MSARDRIGATSPGRAFERTTYRFDVLADYGAFRDLQRHRLLSLEWQRLSPEFGADVPEQVELAGCGDEYRRALEISRWEYERLADPGGLATAAPYVLFSVTGSGSSST